MAGHGGLSSCPTLLRPKHARRALGAVVGALALGLIACRRLMPRAWPRRQPRRSPRSATMPDYSLASRRRLRDRNPRLVAERRLGGERQRVREGARLGRRQVARDQRDRKGGLRAVLRRHQQHPTFRLFARRTSGTWGVLNVKLRWTDGARHHETVVGSVTAADTAWHPTVAVRLAHGAGHVEQPISRRRRAASSSTPRTTAAHGRSTTSTSTPTARTEMPPVARALRGHRPVLDRLWSPR